MTAIDLSAVTEPTRFCMVRDGYSDINGETFYTLVAEPSATPDDPDTPYVVWLYVSTFGSTVRHKTYAFREELNGDLNRPGYSFVCFTTDFERMDIPEEFWDLPVLVHGRDFDRLELVRCDLDDFEFDLNMTPKPKPRTLTPDNIEQLRPIVAAWLAHESGSTELGDIDVMLLLLKADEAIDVLLEAADEDSPDNFQVPAVYVSILAEWKKFFDAQYKGDDTDAGMLELLGEYFSAATRQLIESADAARARNGAPV